MKKPTAFVSIALALLLVCPAAHGQAVQYEFTGGSMEPTVSSLPSGVTASNFSIGTFTFAALSDNGGSGNSLRLSRSDVGTSSSTALAGPCLSFSLTIPAGVTLNLSSLSLDFTSGGVTGAEYINVRVFSSIDGFDNLTADTIGTLGRVANGTDSGSISVNLATPDSNTPTNGSNSNNGDFDSLTNRIVTFYLPFIRDSQTTATDYLDIDNITLSFDNGPPPTPEITSFTATAISSFETALSWNEPFSDETGFIIERSIENSGVWETVISTEANTTSIRDLTVSPGTRYSYRISASFSASSSSPPVLSNSVTVPAASSAPLIIMPMGDSITQGAGAGGGYRSPLYNSLSNAAFALQFVGSRSDSATTLLTNAGQIHHEGHGSYSTDLLLGNLDANKPYGGTDEGGYWITGISGTRAPVYPDLILLMIGTNDIGMWAHTPAQTIAYYDQLLTKLITLRPSTRIICASVVPFVLSEFEQAYPDKVGVYTNREANNVIYNGMLPGLVATHQAAGHRVQFYDMRQKVSAANALTLIGGDGVHPNQAGYNAIASGWFDAMKQLPLMSSWRILHFGTASSSGNAADLADPDGDGDHNLTEYALGSDPTTANPRPVRGSMYTESGTSYLSVNFPRRKHADLQYIVETSADLTSWAADTQQVGTPVSLNADFEQVTFRDRQPFSSNEKRFIRIRIAKP